MAVTALISDKTFLVEQKNQLEFEEISATDQYNYYTQELADMSTSSSSTTSSTYKSLEYESEYWDSKKSSLESQLEEINAELESYDKAIQTNVKSECSFTISV